MTINTALRIAAVVVFALVAVAGFADKPFSHDLDWIALGLALFAGSFLP